MYIDNRWTGFYVDFKLKTIEVNVMPSEMKWNKCVCVVDVTLI